MKVAILLLIGLARQPVIPWPDLTQATQAGCELTQHSLERDVSWWHTHVWIQLPEKRWVYLFSVRPGNERSKALKDCDQFLEMFHKRKARAAEERPSAP